MRSPTRRRLLAWTGSLSLGPRTLGKHEPARCWPQPLQWPPARILYFKAPRALVHSYIVGLSLIYVLVYVHTPLSIPFSPHDDMLFVKLGGYLAEGKWLGPYDQFTLMKGPGYPAFLAIV